MRVWTNNKFTGHWPVGTAAVVVADSAWDAALLLNKLLLEEGLEETVASEFEELVLEVGQARILCKGDY